MMNDTDVKLKCLHLLRVAETVRRTYVNQLKDYSSKFSLIQNRNPIYIFKERIKNEISLHKKIIRKSKNRTEYDVNLVEDVWGCRFVCLFSDDIPNVFSDFLRSELLSSTGDRKVDLRVVNIEVYNNYENNGYFQNNNSVFKQSSVDSIKEGESISEQIRQIYQQFYNNDRESNFERPKFTTKRKESGYTSVHLIIETNVILEPSIFNENESNNKVSFRFEIQIRDIFEELWSEIEHYLIYSEKENVNIKQSDEIFRKYDKFWKPHLNVLKAITMAGSQYASLIMRTARDIKVYGQSSYERYFSTESPTQNGKKLTDVIKKYNLLSVEDCDKIADAYEFIKEAQGAPIEDAMIIFYQKATKIFEDMKSLLQNNEMMMTRKELDGKSIYYYFELEILNSQVVLEKGKISDSIVKRYAAIVEKYPDDAISHIRYGRALGIRSRSNFEEFPKAIQIIERGIRLCESEKMTDHWIYLFALNILSFEYYVAFERDKKIKPKNFSLDFLEKSIATSEQQVSAAEAILKEPISKQDEFSVTKYREYYFKGMTNYFYFCYVFFADGGELAVSKRRKITQSVTDIWDILLHDRAYEKYRDIYSTWENLLVGALIAENVSIAEQSLEKLERILMALARKAAIDSGQDVDVQLTNSDVLRHLPERPRNAQIRSFTYAALIEELRRRVGNDNRSPETS